MEDGKAWETLRREDWPSWVIAAAYPGDRSDSLRRAWEGNRRLHFTGRTFRYRVTPAPSAWGHGHMEIGKLERQLR